MWVGPLLTFVVVLGIGLGYAQFKPNSWGWTAAEYIWVMIATSAIFTAIENARIESQSFERSVRIRDIKLRRDIANRFARSQIIAYKQRLQERQLPEQEQQTLRDGIEWFEVASDALREVHNSDDWMAYLPRGSHIKDYTVPEPDVSRNHWVAVGKQTLSEFVAEIKDSFDSLDDLEPDIASKNWMSLFIMITPYLLAIAAALELAGIRAKALQIARPSPA